MGSLLLVSHGSRSRPAMIDRYLAAVPAMSAPSCASILHRGLPAPFLVAALGKSPCRTSTPLRESRRSFYPRYGLAQERLAACELAIVLLRGHARKVRPTTSEEPVLQRFEAEDEPLTMSSFLRSFDSLGNRLGEWMTVEAQKSITPLPTSARRSATNGQRHFGIIAKPPEIPGQQRYPPYSRYPELHTLLISVRQVSDLIVLAQRALSAGARRIRGSAARYWDTGWNGAKLFNIGDEPCGSRARN